MTVAQFLAINKDITQVVLQWDSGSVLISVDEMFIEQGAREVKKVSYSEVVGAVLLEIGEHVNDTKTV